MARAKKLKVFRTPIGFHDAYVAAPSQKAALEAWGTDTNLFARGVAEQVTDEELTREPLARPGEVIRRMRGSASEQIAALGEERAGGTASMAKPRSKETPKKAAKPDRGALDRAEQQLEKLESEQQDELKTLEREIEKLERRRRDMLRRQESRREALTQQRDRARAEYHRALRRWGLP